MKAKIIFFVMSMIGVFAQAQGWGQTQKIVPSDREQHDNFGYATAMSGDYAVVGAYRDNSPSSDMGSAYVYKKDTSGNWTEHQKLTAPDIRQFDTFGYSVSISNNYLIIGCRGQDYDSDGNNFVNAAGAAYIYEKDTNNNWNFVQKLVAPVRAFEDVFGESVAIDGDFVIVAAPWEDEDVNEMNTIPYTGSAYIFERNGSGVWDFKQKLSASLRVTQNRFGSTGSVAISGNTAIVGSARNGEDESDTNTILSSGSVYIFERNIGGIWSQTNKIVASDREQGEWFGASVGISDNTIIVGASQEYFQNNTNAQYGAAYIFDRDTNGVWNEVQKVRPSYLNHGSKFGLSIAIDGNRFIVGANLMDIGSMSAGGAAFMFEKDGTGIWNETAVMYDPNASSNDYFGFSVAISGDYSLVGAYLEGEDENNENSIPTAGSVYIFEVNEANTLPPLITLSVANSDFKTTIKAYPNPVSNYLIIENKGIDDLQMHIVNAFGQEIIKSQLIKTNESKEIGLLNLRTGIYFLSFKDEKGGIQTKKIIKN